MKGKFLSKIQAINHTPQTHNHLNFSLVQDSHAKFYVHDSLKTLKDLCSKVVLNIRQILITCCDILDMLKNVPSIDNPHVRLDMTSCVCEPIATLASYMDAYDVDPSNVKSSMIREKCNTIADC